MSNTVITNYTDLNGPSTKADSSVVVIVNKDGSLSVDQNLLGTLMGTDGSQAAGISVVRVGHEGKPDDATDSESDDDKVPHVTLSVDSYYDEPNSIIKYDSGAEMLQSLRIETRENSLIGFQNDHCYTPFTSPSQNLPQSSDRYDDPVIEITHTPPPKPVPNSKKITILEQQIIPKGKKIVLNSAESPVILKGNDVLSKPLPVLPKTKNVKEHEKSTDNLQKTDESGESSSISSEDSIPDRDSDSDYKETKERSGSLKIKKTKLKPRILKNVPTPKSKLDPKVAARLKANKNILKKEVKEKVQTKSASDKRVSNANVDLESLIPSSEISTNMPAVAAVADQSKNVVKQTPKPVKKEKKTPAHMSALLSDMTSLFSTPDVIRRVSTDNKIPTKDSATVDKKLVSIVKTPEPNTNEFKSTESILKVLEDNSDKPKPNIAQKTYMKQKEKATIPKVFPSDILSSPIPQLDDASLAQILQDTTGTTNPVKIQPGISTASSMNSPGLAGPLSPTLDLLGGLQPEEEGLTEDLLMHVAQLVESSENLQEVIDKQVLGKVDTTLVKVSVQSPFQQTPSSLYAQTLTKSAKSIATRKDPIEIVRRDGRVITLPPIEAPATRSSKRKSQMETSSSADVLPTPVSVPPPPVATTPEPQMQAVSKQYVNKKMTTKKQEQVVQTPVVDKISAESQESWNSEDDPYRLWCICKQPHNNRFMICCDGCEDWFHGKCVNITKAMGQAMEEQGIEWRCPNCIKKTPKAAAKTASKDSKVTAIQKKPETDVMSTSSPVIKEVASKTNCIVCKKPARASSIYCSDACILKHAQDSLSVAVHTPPGKSEGTSGKTQGKQKTESRVIVFERKTGRLLAGPNAPTAENLKAWLQKNPTFEVVRPDSLSPIRPTITKKKVTNEPTKIQTTLNFERIPKKLTEQPTTSKSILEPKARSQQLEPKMRPQPEMRPKMQHVEPKSRSLPQERFMKNIASPKEEVKPSPQPRTPVSSKSQPPLYIDTPRPSTSTAKPTIAEPRRIVRTSSRSQAASEKVPSVSPSTSRRKDSLDSKNKMVDSSDSIRENVKKALQEQMSLRMAETTGAKFSEDEIIDFANETELELHELFRDVGMKYKAKYRSLMFNIKDRKNLSLWQKICDRTITPKQLVRLSPEELASQELAQWREEEAKHQLELIKKSELDLLAASKTYVLKTHKGEEVMETKESVSTELDPSAVPVEDVVTALNEEAAGDESKNDTSQDLDSTTNKVDSGEKKHSRKRGRDDSFEYSKKDRRDSKRDSDSRKSRSSRRKSEMKERDSKESRRSTRRSDKKSSRAKSESRERSAEDAKEKTDTGERARYRSRSRAKSKRPSKSREHSRSASRGRSPARARRRDSKRERSRRSGSAEDKSKHRSRSQDNTKTKHDSTDSDSVERPKSAMLKEAHPEYDPHEPMITSAFSEEDLRKSREDVFEDTFKDEAEEFDNNDYDASKTFSIDANVISPDSKYERKKDKVSEAESDQEPSSTVDNSAATVWNGCINMVDVARFYVAAHEVSGSAADLEEDLSAELDIVGRINPDTVWDYIGKMKRASNKDIVILRLQAANDEEKMQYIALYSYLSSRNRLGVVKVSNTTSVKDFYIVPLPANTALPPVLLPLDGPGLGDAKTHLLIAIVIRQRKRRLTQHIPQEIIPAKVARESRKRSYTPPIVGKSSYTPPASPRRRALPLPAYTSPALSTSVKDKIAASLASADDEEAYSPGSSSSSGSAPAAAQAPPASNTLRTKMEELNRQIEEQKQQILKMARADSSVGEDEAYSPSRPMTPPAVVPLADIALPSNLQEILATIKQRSEPAPSTDVDMRTMPLP